MGDFFKGWRRKAGCVTLVMACTFAAAWVRSFIVEDRMTHHRTQSESPNELMRLMATHKPPNMKTTARIAKMMMP